MNRVRGLDHLYGRFFAETDTLGVVRRREHVQRAATSRRRRSRRSGAIRPPRASIARVSRHGSRPPDKTLVLTLEAQGLPFFTRQIMQLDSIYLHAGRVERHHAEDELGRDRATRCAGSCATPRPARRTWTSTGAFRRGDVVRIRLVNERQSFHGMQHPIHIHGQRFLVLAVNGVPNTNLVWKDTVLLPAGATVDILLDLSNPGRWMLHCHIAEHLSAE